MLHRAVPHFAERDEKTNSFKQQDAHECWSAILTSLTQTLKFGNPADQQVNMMDSLSKLCAQIMS